ncbi:MAG: glycerophosphodiester phosphodiesterase family protein [Myxococcota bacterium]
MPHTHEPNKAVCLVVGGMAWLGVAVPAQADCADGRPVTMGHRGTGTSGGNAYPENTIPSVLQAAKEGATAVEIDVQLSADGVPVLMHDAHVDGTTDGMGCVTELTVAELQMLDAGAGTPMAGAGVTVPTLAEVLAASPLDVNVEIKAGGEGCPVFSDEEVASAIVEVLADDPMTRHQAVSSFELGILEAVRDLDPDLYVGMLTVGSLTARVAVKAGFNALNIIDGGVDETSVAETRRAGLEVNAWTIDDPGRMHELFELDVDAIMTDEPDVMEMVRAERCDVGGDSGSTGGSTGGADETGAPGGTASDGESSTSEAGSSGEASTTGAAMNDEGTDTGCGCRAQGFGGWGSFGWAAWSVLLIGRRRR